MSEAATAERPRPPSPPSAMISPAAEKVSFEGQLRERADALAAMLPSDVSKDRFLNSVIAAVRNKPEILDASPRSVFAAITDAAQDGLLPDGKEGVINVYKTKIKGRNGQSDQWVPTAKWMPMTHGIRKRARELDKLIINAQIVYENDEWDREEGDDPHIIHRPPKKFGAPRGEMLGAYAIFKREGSGEILHREVMTKLEIADVQAQSKDPDGLMWKKFTTEAWRKTVVRRGIKTVPVSDGLDRVVRRDDDIFNFSQERVTEALSPPSPPSPPSAPKAITNNPGTPASILDPIPETVEADLDRAALRQIDGGLHDAPEEVEAKTEQKAAASSPPSPPPAPKPIDIKEIDQLADWVSDQCKEAESAMQDRLNEIDDSVCRECEQGAREDLRKVWKAAFYARQTVLSKIKSSKK